ncbi:hypothetical protein PIROE2DRAFT_9455 [Piromyces sp. E2]|nr:hypothetical protein PIROE2DRAFT_9455 [Piromyces sp. E2]|eukprot:OUM63924.1 hypothetical protein PIROE2DRAFT_9455 [Piromyces sp. E2]
MCEGYVHTSNMVSGKAIFSRFWNVDLGDNNSKFYVTNLPGREEGFSASIVGGYNVIINDKKLNKYSALNDVYYDDELCSIKDCELFKNMQYVSRPISFADDYDKYSEEFRDYFIKFLTGKLTAEEALKNIDDISRIYYVEANSTIGKIFIVLIILILLTVASLLGICIMSIYGLFNLGRLSIFKCNAKTLVIFLGLSLFHYPLLIKEVIHFPQENEYSFYISKHKNLCMLCLFLFDVIISIIFCATSPYEVNEHIIKGEENYEKYNINISYYKTDVKLKTSLTILFTIVNYSVIIWYKMYFEITQRNKEEDLIRSNKKTKTMGSESMSTSNISENKSVMKKIINMHYSSSALENKSKSSLQSGAIHSSQFTEISEITKTNNTVITTNINRSDNQIFDNITKSNVQNISRSENFK